MSKGIIKSGCAIFILSILIASSALAQKPQVNITEVMVDFDSQSISVMGENFDIGPNPTTVSLGGFGNLNITTNTSNLLVAGLPSGIPAGDYLLSVSSGPGPKKNAQQSITIGAQGPQGDMGTPGDPGDPGDQGPQGPQGPAGPQGPTGATGPQGPQGLTGAAGAQGPQGEQGPAGQDGQDGAPGNDGIGSLINTIVEPVGGDCALGGIQIESGNDLDGNGVLSESEVISRRFICNGEQGPEGPQGLTGAAGAQGPAGPQGVAGVDGATGPQGPQGDTGATGPAGADGADGTDGADAAPIGVEFVITSLDGCETYRVFRDNNNDGNYDETGLEINGVIIPADQSLTTYQICNGADGTDGTDGADGVSGYQRTSETRENETFFTFATIRNCTGGKKIISGGCSANSSQVAILSNYASSDTAWTCQFVTLTGGNVTANLTSSMICGNVN